MKDHGPRKARPPRRHGPAKHATSRKVHPHRPIHNRPAPQTHRHEKSRLGGYAIALTVSAGMTERDTHTIPTRRNLQRLETLLLITIFPAMVWLSGLWELIRNLNLIGHR